MLNFGLNIQTSVLYTVEALSVFYSVSMFVFGGIKAREPVLSGERLPRPFENIDPRKKFCHMN